MIDHTMPMLTDRERENEIIACHAAIQLLEDDLSRNEGHPAIISDLRRQRIALAALKAEPSAYITVQGGCRAPDDCEFYHELSEKEDLSCNGTPAFPVYEAPPVPAMKPVVLPQKMSPWMCGAGYTLTPNDNGDAYRCDMVIRAIRAAGYEVQE